MIKNLLGLFFFSALLLTSPSLLAQKSNIKVSDFNLSTKEQKVIIDWKTDGTTATNYFAIQKSADGITFKTIALVLGPDPKQKGDIYGCTDKFTQAKNLYYRLVHIDTNGNEQITEAKLLAKL